MTDLEELKKQLREKGSYAHTTMPPKPSIESRAVDAIEHLQRELGHYQMAANAEADYANELKEKNDVLQRELEDMKHDLERSIATSADLATELEEARRDAERRLDILTEINDNGYLGEARAVEMEYGGSGQDCDRVISLVEMECDAARQQKG